MNIYRLTLQYNGYSYSGWQIQPNVKTIQGELNKVLEKISLGSVRTIGSGRTDAGVHALCQVVRVEMELEIDSEALMKGLNSLLPKDIQVTSSEKSNLDFHPLASKNKEYRYYFSSKSNPFSAQQLTTIKNEFNEAHFESMKEASKCFVGEFDFKSYQCVGTEVNSTVREVYECSLNKINKGHELFPFFPSETYEFRIVGNGFLKQMVRLMVGAVLKAGKGQLSPAEITESLTSDDSNKVAAVAPAHGLYLYRVTY